MTASGANSVHDVKKMCADKSEWRRSLRAGSGGRTIGVWDEKRERKADMTNILWHDISISLVFCGRC